MLQARLKKTFPPAAESAGFVLDVDLEAHQGVTVLFGPSGAGKTLTLDMVAGFATPDEGRILLDDHLLLDVKTKVSLPPQARHCGYVFQNYALFPHMTLRENLDFAAGSKPKLERHRLVNELLETFQLTPLAGRLPAQVSGGQRQRCSIARALIVEPRILLLDEPSRGLDAALKQDLYRVLRQVRDDFKTPILLVTHDLEECFALADRMCVMWQGRVVQKGEPREVLDAPANADVARLLGVYNLLPVEIKLLDPGQNKSVLKWEGGDLGGVYYPGRFLGDRVVVCFRRDSLRATPQNRKAGANEVAATLRNVTELARSVVLEMAGGLEVEMPLAEFELNSHHREWIVEIPAQHIRIL